MSISNNSLLLSSLNQSLSSVVKDKLAELREWLNLMDKRREGDDQIGPDSMTIKKQITEMNVSFFEIEVLVGSRNFTKNRRTKIATIMILNFIFILSQS